MAGNRDDIVSGYVRMRIRAWKDSGQELQELARIAGFAKSTPSQVLLGTGVGAKTGPRFAKALGFESFDALKLTAFEWWKSHGQSGATAAATPASPGQAEAVDLVRGLGQGSEAQLQTILSAYSHPLFLERDRDWWVQTLLAELARDRQVVREDKAAQESVRDAQKETRAAHRRRAEVAAPPKVARRKRAG